MNKKMVLLQVSVITLLICILCTASWLYHNRSEAVYNRIINQEGYSLSLVKENVEVEFFLKPDWIPKEVGETNLDLVIAQKFDSDIVLERIGKRATDFYIELNVVPHADRTSGQILSISHLTDDVLTGGGNPKWQITDTVGKDILGGTYGGGEGPGNLTSVSINDTDLGKFSKGAAVRFSGFYLYGYQKYNTSYYGVLPSIIFTVLVVGSLVALYRKRTDPEKGLGWKLIGHVMLGGFTFALNGFKLPLGFVIYLLFFRKPKPNLAVKHRAALLGLLMYVLQLVVPPAVNHLGSNPHSSTMRHIAVEELGMDGVWKMIAARAPVSDQARMQDFDIIKSENDEVKELAFEFIEQEPASGRFLHTTAIYNAEDQSIALKQFRTDEWVQYPRQMMAKHFIERVQSLKLMDLKPTGGNHRYVNLKLFLDSVQGSYAMKGENNFGVDEKGVYRIHDEQLPVTANLLKVCAPQTIDPVFACSDPANYFFDIVEGGARN